MLISWYTFKAFISKLETHLIRTGRNRSDGSMLFIWFVPYWWHLNTWLRWCSPDSLRYKITLIPFIMSKNFIPIKLIWKYVIIPVFFKFSVYVYLHLSGFLCYSVGYNILSFFILKVSLSKIWPVGHKLACVLLTCPIILWACPYFLAQLEAPGSTCTSLLQPGNQPFCQKEKWGEWYREAKIWARWIHCFVTTPRISQCTEYICTYTPMEILIPPLSVHYQKFHSTFFLL